MNSPEKILTVFFVLGLTLVFFILGPFITIWSINCLFGTEIPVAFKTWCAMAWLLLLLSSQVNKKNG